MATHATDHVLVRELAALPAVTVHPAVSGRVAFTVAGLPARQVAEHLDELDVCEVGVAALPVAYDCGLPAEAVTVGVPRRADADRLVAAAVEWTVQDLTGRPGGAPASSAATVRRLVV